MQRVYNVGRSTTSARERAHLLFDRVMHMSFVLVEP